jgi:hypothetical protein
MAENFRLDPHALSTANGDFKVVGDTLGDAFHVLTGVLDDHDGCWGSDDIGKAFEKNYKEPAKEVRGYAGDAIEGMVDLHEGVDESKETFESVDYENAKKIDASVTDQ